MKQQVDQGATTPGCGNRDADQAHDQGDRPAILGFSLPVVLGWWL